MNAVGSLINLASCLVLSARRFVGCVSFWETHLSIFHDPTCVCLTRSIEFQYYASEHYTICSLLMDIKQLADSHAINIDLSGLWCASRVLLHSYNSWLLMFQRVTQCCAWVLIELPVSGGMSRMYRSEVWILTFLCSVFWFEAPSLWGLRLRYFGLGLPCASPFRPCHQRLTLFWPTLRHENVSHRKLAHFVQVEISYLQPESTI